VISSPSRDPPSTPRGAPAMLGEGIG
jgi:hypothetical protein